MYYIDPYISNSRLERLQLFNMHKSVILLLRSLLVVYVTAISQITTTSTSIFYQPVRLCRTKAGTAARPPPALAHIVQTYQLQKPAQSYTHRQHQMSSRLSQSLQPLAHIQRAKRFILQSQIQLPLLFMNSSLHKTKNTSSILSLSLRPCRSDKGRTNKDANRVTCFQGKLLDLGTCFALYKD